MDLFWGVLFLACVFWFVYRVRISVDYDWNWQKIPRYLFRFDEDLGKWVPNLIMQGFFNTIRLSVWAMIPALFFGTVMGIFRSSPSLFKRLVGGAYVELLRNLPPLVLVFIFYFFISSQLIPLTGIEDVMYDLSERSAAWIGFFFSPPERFPAFFSALTTLAVFEGAYITEIVRSGIQAVDKGQVQAAAALGMSRSKRMRHVILPQAFRNVAPQLAGQFISTIKDSSIVSVISIQELTFQGMEVMSSTYMTFEIWITITVLYLILTLSCSLIFGRLGKAPA